MKALHSVAKQQPGQPRQARQTKAGDILVWSDVATLQVYKYFSLTGCKVHGLLSLELRQYVKVEGFTVFSSRPNAELMTDT